MSAGRSIAKIGLPTVNVADDADPGPAPADVHAPCQPPRGAMNDHRWATLQPIDTDAKLGDPARPALPCAPGSSPVTLVASAMTVSRKDTQQGAVCATIRHKKVSSRHCLITRCCHEEDAIADDVLARCLDLGSTGGTFVLRRDADDASAGFVKLTQGDEIELRCYDLIKTGHLRDEGLTFQLVPADSINTDYRIATALVLGTGVGGEVVVGENRLTGISYAIKTVVKGANKKAQERSKTEVALMQKISHPHICKLMSVYEHPQKYHLIMERVVGGDLFERIRKRSKPPHAYCMPEAQCKHLFHQLVSAVAYLHSMDIVHRDIKPENILLASEADFPIVKLSDFGLSSNIGENSFRKSCVGTRLFMAPEVMKCGQEQRKLGSAQQMTQQKYDRSVDLWSVGVVLYTCLAGYNPIEQQYPRGQYPHGVPNSVKTDQLYKLFTFDGGRPSPGGKWGQLKQAEVLVRKMLVNKNQERITAKDALASGWLSLSKMESGRLDRLLEAAASRTASECRAEGRPAKKQRSN